jgi:hypothetical protein
MAAEGSYARNCDFWNREYIKRISCGWTRAYVSSNQGEEKSEEAEDDRRKSRILTGEKTRIRGCDDPRGDIHRSVNALMRQSVEVRQKNTEVTSSYRRRRWCVGKHRYVNPVSVLMAQPEGSGCRQAEIVTSSLWHSERASYCAETWCDRTGFKDMRWHFSSYCGGVARVKKSIR